MSSDPQDLNLDPEAEYRATMRVLIGERWARLWEAIPAAVAGEDIEGVHQVRVASRHLRAAMDVAAGCFPDKWYRPLHREAKDVTGALGDVRDLDVLLETFGEQRRRMRVADRAGVDLLIAELEREQTRARKRMVAYLTKLEKRGVRAESTKRFPIEQDES